MLFFSILNSNDFLIVIIVVLSFSNCKLNCSNLMFVSFMFFSFIDCKNLPSCSFACINISNGSESLPIFFAYCGCDVVFDIIFDRDPPSVILYYKNILFINFIPICPLKIFGNH